jgi:hypothetical protein
MRQVTEIVPIYRKVGRGRHHRSEFLLWRLGILGRNGKPWLTSSHGDATGSRGMIELSLTKAVLHSESTTGIFPFDRTINTGDLTRAAFQTAGIFDGHLFFLVQRIKVCRAGINAKTFFAIMTDFLVKLDMGFFVVFKGIQSEFLSYLH